MNKRVFNFWIIFVVGIIAFGWMIAELIRAFFEVKGQSGLSAVPLNGVMQHKIGELMVGLSNLRSGEKVFSLIRQTRFVMIVGGLLNALAWYSLREKAAVDSFLRIWCLVIFVFGSLGSWLLSWMVNRIRHALQMDG